MSHIVRRPRGSSPVVGSSRKTIRGIADERHRQVETALLAAGVGRDHPAGDVDEIEAIEEVGDAAPALVARQMVEIRHELEVLLAGQEVVDRRELAGDADLGAHALRIGPQVMPPDLDLAGVGSEHRGEHVDGRRLAGAVRAEQGEDRSRGDLEVDPVEHDVVAVGLAKAGGPNRGARS